MTDLLERMAIALKDHKLRNFGKYDPMSDMVVSCPEEARLMLHVLLEELQGDRVNGAVQNRIYNAVIADTIRSEIDLPITANVALKAAAEALRGGGGVL